MIERSLHLDQFYDVPSYIIELLGGPSDGKRFHSSHVPQFWYEACYPELNIATIMMAPFDKLIEYQTHMYFYTGHVLDDGTRLYSYRGAF